MQQSDPGYGATASVVIVLLNYNSLPHTLRCLASISVLDYPRLQTIVVDNASTDDPEAAIRDAYPWCGVIRNGENEGWAGGNNVGIRYGLSHGADYVLLLNNDTVVSPQLVTRLVEAADRERDFAVIGPVINEMDQPETVQTEACLFNCAGGEGFFERVSVPLIRGRTPPSIVESDIVNGCCMMVRSSVFERIGLIDERFFLVHEESDFCLRALRAGFRCGVIGESLVWHKGSSTFESTGRSVQRYYDARNLLLLLNEHADHHDRGRSRWRSRLEYLKYVYYRYCIEREADELATADAALEGLYDAVCRRFGRYSRRRRLPVPLLRALFEWRRALRTREHRRLTNTTKT